MYSDFDGTLLRELEHIDSTVTVLSTFNNGGLEVGNHSTNFDIAALGLTISLTISKYLNIFSTCRTCIQLEISREVNTVFSMLTGAVQEPIQRGSCDWR